MDLDTLAQTASAARIDDLPALMLGAAHAVRVAHRGAPEEVMRFADAREALSFGPHLLVGAPFVARRIGLQSFRSFDLLELFAFVHPATFAAPTPAGLAQALAVEGEGPGLLYDLAEKMLDAAGKLPEPAISYAASDAFAMARAGWAFGPMLLNRLGTQRINNRVAPPWASLPKWRDEPPPPPPGNEALSEVEILGKLQNALGEKAEPRDGQRQLAATVNFTVFQPKRHPEEPNLLLAEAGTGIGKTAAYLAAATGWAARNNEAVWVATYTKNLQRQIDQELVCFYPKAAEKERRVVLRKGRDNYLCLLNYEEAWRELADGAGPRVPLGLIGRWIRASRDGDLAGGDLPGWLTPYLGAQRLVELTDRRGECTYNACPHYKACFIERSTRMSRQADIVVANHALLLSMAARSQPLPRYVVLDEGHHLFEAADSAFALSISGLEGQDLRRWCLGPETTRPGRARGLKGRLEALSGDTNCNETLDDVLNAARLLPSRDWAGRLERGQETTAFERFLGAVRQTILKHHQDIRSPYSLDMPVPADPALQAAADALIGDLTKLATPMTALAKGVAEAIEQAGDDLESGDRARLDVASRALDRRADQLRGWVGSLNSLGETPERAVDWLGIERIDGRDVDVGFHRHLLDPTEALTSMLYKPSAGVLVTSATLRDASAAEDMGWKAAEARTGAAHLVQAAGRSQHASPFDYAANSLFLVITDLNKADARAVAKVTEALFLAAGGAALGIFTAIRRLREVHMAIAPQLEAAGLPLYAQHVDAIDTSTLIDIFRAEPKACLLGTDAVRDGIDVPGDALRLVVMDKVPWPRPSVLHTARRAHFGGRGYDEMLVRFKLKQAFGRLLRRQGDHGVFVMLDGATPSRLLTGLPEGTPVERLPAVNALNRVRDFLSRVKHKGDAS